MVFMFRMQTLNSFPALLVIAVKPRANLSLCLPITKGESSVAFLVLLCISSTYTGYSLGHRLHCVRCRYHGSQSLYTKSQSTGNNRTEV